MRKRKLHFYAGAVMFSKSTVGFLSMLAGQLIVRCSEQTGTNGIVSMPIQ